MRAANAEPEDALRLELLRELLEVVDDDLMLLRGRSRLQSRICKLLLSTFVLGLRDGDRIGKPALRIFDIGVRTRQLRSVKSVRSNRHDMIAGDALERLEIVHLELEELELVVQTAIHSQRGARTNEQEVRKTHSVSLAVSSSRICSSFATLERAVSALAANKRIATYVDLTSFSSLSLLAQRALSSSS